MKFGDRARSVSENQPFDEDQRQWLADYFLTKGTNQMKQPLRELFALMQQADVGQTLQLKSPDNFFYNEVVRLVKHLGLTHDHSQLVDVWSMGSEWPEEAGDLAGATWYLTVPPVRLPRPLLKRLSGNMTVETDSSLVPVLVERRMLRSVRRFIRRNRKRTEDDSPERLPFGLAIPHGYSLSDVVISAPDRFSEEVTIRMPCDDRLYVKTSRDFGERNQRTGIYCSPLVTGRS